MLSNAMIAAQVAGRSAFAEWLPVGFWLALLASLLSITLLLMHRRRERTNDHLADISASHPDLLVSIDTDGRIAWINVAAAERLGRTPAEATGRMADDVLPGALLAALRKPQGWSNAMHEHRLTGADGRGLWVEARVVALPDGQVLLNMHDVTGLKERETELAKARDDQAARALHDPLTGLPNRAAVEPRLLHEIGSAQRRGRRVGVLHLDLRDFGAYATAFGTAAADAALVAAARRLREALEPGAYLGRFEGDRFVAVLSGPEGEAPVERQANRLIAALDEALDAPGRPVFGLAAGLAILPEDAADKADPARLNDEAAIALNARKREGIAGLTRFRPELRKHADAAARLARELERGRLAKQFEPWFRPRISPADRRPTGLVVELRWHHPSRRMLSPQELIAEGAPAALVAATGAQVLERAVELFAGWREDLLFAGALILPLPGAGPAATDFLDRLKFAVDRYEITPANVVVSFPGPQTPAKPFSEAGFRIERSAAGPEAATVGDLLTGPTDVLRVTLPEPRGRKTEAFDALLGLAQAAGTTVLATNIGSEAQAERAAKQGIDQIEGSLAGEAIAAEDVADLLSGGSDHKKSGRKRA